jgi:hypothetical protein
MLLSQEARVSPSPSFFLGETLRDVRVEGSTSWILVIVMGKKKAKAFAVYWQLPEWKDYRSGS